MLRGNLCIGVLCVSSDEKRFFADPDKPFFIIGYRQRNASRGLRITSDFRSLSRFAQSVKIGLYARITVLRPLLRLVLPKFCA